LINIFGGITRGDDVARGLVTAVQRMKPKVPLVIRITGTNEDLARDILEEVGLKAASSMTDAVKQSIEAAKRTT
jgi:succinyl-CoA synthetase beta subunit